MTSSYPLFPPHHIIMVEITCWQGKAVGRCDCKRSTSSSSSSLRLHDGRASSWLMQTTARPCWEGQVLPWNLLDIPVFPVFLLIFSDFYPKMAPCPLPKGQVLASVEIKKLVTAIYSLVGTVKHQKNCFEPLLLQSTSTLRELYSNTWNTLKSGLSAP